MNDSDKFMIRRAVLELAKAGIPRTASIDDNIRKTHNLNFRAINLWDYVTLIGAQLSRPAYDPYRETINLDISIGIGKSRKIVLNIPLIIYGNINMNSYSLESLHLALNRLAEKGQVLGLILEGEINTKKDKRKYPVFKKISSISENHPGELLGEYNHLCPDGLVFEYRDHSSVDILRSLREQFDGPILVDISNFFPSSFNSILDLQIDGILVDTEMVTKNSRYKGKHAIKVICDTRNAINSYYKCKEESDDNAILVVAGDVNSTGKIAKAAALGADIIGYSTSMLIANSQIYSEKPYDVISITENVYRHMMGTKEELRGIPAALGYSDFHNISPSDLRTSSIDASLQGNIPLEGIDKTYLDIIGGVIDELISSKELDMTFSEVTDVLKSIGGE